MKSVLISIQPKWCELIANGKKTIEVRKTKPKLETPFKVYIYCTIGGDYKYRVRLDENRVQHGEVWNGKVIGEFVCECVTSLKADNIVQAYYNNTQATCLTDKEIMGYANGGKLYYWHISNLVIYDKPRELNEFFKACEKPKGTDCSVCIDRRENKCKAIIRPPQSWCYVESEVSSNDS